MDEIEAERIRVGKILPDTETKRKPKQQQSRHYKDGVRQSRWVLEEMPTQEPELQGKKKRKNKER